MIEIANIERREAADLRTSSQSRKRSDDVSPMSAIFIQTTHSSIANHLSFSVVSANSENTSARIQNRVITFDSDHPINSK